MAPRRWSLVTTPGPGGGPGGGTGALLAVVVMEGQRDRSEDDEMNYVGAYLMMPQ